MDILDFKQTPKTPSINLDHSTGVLDFKGKSIPENAKVFYQPVFDWLGQYLQNPAANTTLNIQFDYFNTSSAKSLIDLFRTMEKIATSNKSNVIINWHYNDQDEDMQEAGKGYKSILKVTFNLISFT